MQLNGRHFNQAMIAAIQAAIDAEPELSGRALSRYICEWLNWCSPNGKLNEVSCRKTLPTLRRNGLVQLPETTIPPGLRRPPRNGEGNNRNYNLNYCH